MRRARVWFSSLSTGQASRYWDGLGLVNGEPVVLRHVPGDASTLLAEEELRVGEVREVRLRAMVPGLASIPQAISVEVE